MNYEALQLLIKSLLNNFKCDSCKTWITTKDINIISIEWKRVNLNINCRNCKKSMLVKSEVIWLDLSKMNLTSSQMSMIKNSIDIKNARKTANNHIKDDIINKLSENLRKENFNVNDLLEWEKSN